MKDNGCLIVAIGLSAGGFEPLFQIISNIPQNAGIAYVVLPHLFREWESQLDKILSIYTDVKVVKIKGLEVIEPDTIYTLPENRYALISHGQLFLYERPEEHIINIAIDEFLISLAVDQRQNAVAVILSGMGSGQSLRYYFNLYAITISKV